MYVGYWFGSHFTSEFVQCEMTQVACVPVALLAAQFLGGTLSVSINNLGDMAPAI